MAEFKTINTALGLAAISAAVTLGVPINLTHMAVGDGNGNPVLPVESQTALAREKYRGAVNRVYQSPEHGAFVAELVVPSSSGGFTIREAGIYTSDGTLFAVANIPDTYLVSASSGATSDAVIRIVFRVSNAEVVTLMVDPHVALVTQQWVSNTISIGWLLPGGTTGQYPRKASNADGDFEFVDALEVIAHVDTIEERQTLAEDQTEVELTTCTTRGLALYVDGVRLSNLEWEADLDDDTKLTLAASYPEDSLLIAVQNEPSGASGPPLERAKNLSDLENAATARANLGVMSEADTRALMPVGAIIFEDDIVAPPGFLKRNGANISRSTYAALFAKLGTRHGAGDGVTTFNVGDDRGEFLRGWDDGRGVDTGRALGSAQADAFKSHWHAQATAGTTPLAPGREVPKHEQPGTSGWNLDYVDTHGPVPTDNTGGPETRPRNKAYLVCIKY